MHCKQIASALSSWWDGRMDGWMNRWMNVYALKIQVQSIVLPALRFQTVGNRLNGGS